MNDDRHNNISVSSDSSARGTMSDPSQPDCQSQGSGSTSSSGSMTSGVLQPILTKYARTRSYLVGSIGVQVGTQLPSTSKLTHMNSHEQLMMNFLLLVRIHYWVQMSSRDTFLMVS